MPKIVVEGPDGKKYAFPDTMPREEINAFMKQRYGTKARNETVQDYLARVVREQDATKARAKSVTKEATAAGRAEGERAAARMGVDNPFEMAMAAPAIGLAQQSAGRTVYDREGTMLPDEAAALAAVNAAGFFVPGMVNKQFGERAAEGRRQQPGATFAGDLAGGMIGGEAINLGLQKVGQAVAPAVSQIGRLFKGKPVAAAPEPPMVLGPESRILPVDRPDALPGDDVAMAEALDQWTPPVEQKMMPMGFAAPSGSGRRPIGFLDDLERGTDTFFDARLGPEGSDWNKAVEMAKNGYSNDEIAEAIGWTRDSTKEMLKRARNLGIDVPKAFSPGGIMQTATGTSKDILALREKGLTVRQISERTGKPSGTISSMLSQERARMKKAGEEIPAWLLPEKKAGVSEGNLAENVFGAAYMSGTGSVGGMHIDFNGDGTLDEEDQKIGSLVGLAAFASPLALRKVAELGGRLKGTKAQGMVPKLPETPQQAARYETPGSPEYEAAIAKGLDMSTPARMARAKEQGYDIPLFHKTDADIKAFDPERGGRGATFFAGSPEGAQAGAGAGQNELRRLFAREDMPSGAPSIMPVMAKSEGIAGLRLAPAQKQYWQSLPEEMPLTEYEKLRPEIDKNLGGIPYELYEDSYILMPNGRKIQARDLKSLSDAEFDEVKRTGKEYLIKGEEPKRTYDEVKRSGRDLYGRQIAHYGPGSDEKAIAARYKAMGHTGYLVQDEGGLTVAIFDPANIRSVNAAFDPDKAASPILTAGFGSPAPRRTEAFMDDRLTPSENKALEMRRNGFSTEEIAEEMDTSTNTVLKFISTAKSKGVEVEPIKRGPPMNRTPDVLRLAEQGLRPQIIAERLGLTRNNVSVLLTKERARLKKAGKPIPKWMSPRDPGGNIKETD